MPTKMLGSRTSAHTQIKLPRNSLSFILGNIKDNVHLVLCGSHRQGLIHSVVLLKSQLNELFFHPVPGRIIIHSLHLGMMPSIPPLHPVKNATPHLADMSFKPHLS